MKLKSGKKMIVAILAIFTVVIILVIYSALTYHREIDINSIDTSKLGLSTELVDVYKMKYMDFSNKLNGFVENYKKSKKDADKPDQDYFIEKARYAEYLGQHEEAIWTLNQLLGYYGNSSVAWNNLASIYEGTGDYKKAIKYYQKIIDTFGPQASGKYYVQIARLYLKLNDRERAKSNYIEYRKWSTVTDPELDELIKNEL